TDVPAARPPVPRRSASNASTTTPPTTAPFPDASSARIRTAFRCHSRARDGSRVSAFQRVNLWSGPCATMASPTTLTSACPGRGGSVATLPSLMLADSSTLCSRAASRALDQTLAIPRQLAQLANLPPRDGACPQQPMLQQLRDPFAVLHTRLPAGNGIDRFGSSKISKMAVGVGIFAAGQRHTMGVVTLVVAARARSPHLRGKRKVAEVVRQRCTPGLGRCREVGCGDNGIPCVLRRRFRASAARREPRRALQTVFCGHSPNKGSNL